MENNLPILLLTGASGMLGHYVADLFSDFRIVTIGRHTEDTVYADLVSPFSIPDMSPELCVHAAGTRSPEHAVQVNYEGTLNLLKALEDNPPRSFVYISSMEVYGCLEGEMIGEVSSVWAEEQPGKSRILAERAVWEWCADRGVTCTILRPAPMFGRDVSGWQRDMFNAVNTGYFYLIRGNCARRSIVLAYDVAQIIRRIHRIGGVYNVADPRARSFEDLAEAMARNSGKDKSVYRLPLKWARVLALAGDRIPVIGKVMDSRSFDFQLSSLTYDVSALLEKTDYAFFDTVEVIARRDKTYPYEDA